MDDKNVRISMAKRAFVSTPNVNTILKNMGRCRDYSDLETEPTCMMVYGASGVGKTTIIKKYLKQNQGDSNLEGDIVPVLYIELPENAKPVDAAREMLLALNDPLALSESDSAVLTKRIVELAPALKIELIIIDEFQHLVEKSSNKVLSRVGDWLKMILNKTKCPMVLFGMPYSKVVLDANSQLQGRFSIQLHLRPFSYQHDKGTFEIFLKSLDAALPFKKSSGLSSEKMQKKLYAFSNGNMRSLRNLIYQASIQAIEKGCDSINEEDWVFASELTSGDKPSTWRNPFIAGTTITKQMLADPPKTIGWEDYLRNNKKRGKPGDISELFR
ncbi:TniB family NTP-binding protein [Photobacterium sagamiensis]|uniref:TniB family NTP-binding protein n=1 Tax=Photobacterium sagamiensis TaxID=2910241 RepID=UPI003D135AA7